MMPLNALSVTYQPMVEYSTIREKSILRSKDYNEELSPIDYAIHRSPYGGLSIYELGETWINTTLKDDSRSIKKFSFIAGLHFFSDSIPRTFVRYRRYKRGSRKYVIHIMNLKVLLHLL